MFPRIKIMNEDIYIEIDRHRNEVWRNNKGQYHRVNGPAFIGDNGNKRWFFNGILHRIDGPAMEFTNSYKEWWVNGERHRLDGPAMEWDDGDKEWSIQSIFISKIDCFISCFIAIDL